MAAQTPTQLFTSTAVPAPTGRNDLVDPKPPSLVLQSVLTTTINGETVPVTYVFNVSPNEVNLQRLGVVYSELERPGRKPLLQARAGQLRQVSATVMIVSNRNRYFGNAQLQIDGLIALSEIDADLYVFYPGIPTDLTWRITNLGIRSVRRSPDNEITIAEAEITLTESVTPKAAVPGMQVIKDVPLYMGGKGRTNGSNEEQRDELDRDAETKKLVDDAVAAGRFSTEY